MSSRTDPVKNKIDAAYVANLARLRLTDEELKRMGRQLEDILEYVSRLNEVDTSGTEPTSHVLPMKNVEREDAVGPSLPEDEALKNAPQRQGNFFKVPKVIE